MKILVLIKEVPDTYTNRKLDLGSGLLVRDRGEIVLDEICERAMEVALKYADNHTEAEVIAVTMGSSEVIATLRKALAMGAVRGIHLSDTELRGADLNLTARALAAVISREGFDVVIAGNLSTDGGSGALPAMIAEHLSVVCLNALSQVELSANSVTGTRRVEGGLQTLSADLPAVLSVTEALPEGRFPGFKSIMAAKKKLVETVSAEELGLDTDPTRVPSSIVISVSERPPRAAGVKVTDNGDGGKQIASYLVENRLI